MTPTDAAAQARDYATVDAAAVAFVDLVRSYPDQRKEYCAWLIQTPEGRVRWGVINEGDMNRCPSGERPDKKTLVGTIHTHPIWGEGSARADSAGQMFSEGDFAHGEYFKVPLFLGAPAGHVLRYDAGGSTCWGSSFIARRFKILRDASPSVRGRLPVNSGEKTPLFDTAGKPIPKPSYCVAPIL